jgi:hypothetical protein
MPFSEVDWFSEMAPAWKRFLVPGLTGAQAGAQAGGHRVLMLGSYEARSAVWLLDATAPSPAGSGKRKKTAATRGAGPHLTVVEPLADASDCVGFRGRAVFNPAQRANLVANLAPYAAAGRATLAPGRLSFADFLLRDKTPAYRAVVLDARGNSRLTLECLVLAWRRLQPGGVLCVTNYTHSKERDARCPRRGIDAFIDSYADDLQVLATQWHVFLLKLPGGPRATGPCRSEYFANQSDAPPDCVGGRSSP